MKPLDQTKFGSKEGNCFAAVVASLLEIGIDDLPDLACPEQRVLLNEWLAPRGLYWMDVDAAQFAGYARFMKYHEISGMSPRDIPHSVVGFKGGVYHDPHPDRSGLLPDELGPQEWTYGIFVKVDGKEQA